MNNKNSNDYLVHILQDFVKSLEQNPNSSLAELLQILIHIVAEAERDFHIKHSPADKKNGYYYRKLGTPIGSLDISVPRDRDGDFRPSILPDEYKRDISEKLFLLQSLLANLSYPSEIAAILKDLGMHYNPLDLEEMSKQIAQDFYSHMNRELPSQSFCIMMDAYHARMKLNQKVRDVVLYIALEIDFEGRKDLIGVWTLVGRESKEFWLQVLNSIVDRGLKEILYMVTDDFSGLKDAIKEIYPKCHHQLCFVHMKRNLRRNMASEDAANFEKLIHNIKSAPDYDAGEDIFENALSLFETKYPAYIKKLRNKKQNYLAFLHSPEDVRKHIYTTNAVESVNSMIEKIRIRNGGYFQCEENLMAKLGIVYRHLVQKKWRMRLPAVNAHSYELRQLFATIYGHWPLD